MRPPETAAVAVAVHDVSPATWSECRELFAMLDDVGAAPLSLLVIPDYHHRAIASADRSFVKAMEARLARGDELVLHGYFHLDEAATPRTPRAWFERRMLTRAEGEFAALGKTEAASRLERGVALFEQLGWPLAGFVPPAWLLGDDTRHALAQCRHRFDYVTVRGGMFHLPQWTFERTANLCYSPDTALRRGVSAALIRRELRRARSTPLLRVSLHPQDVRAPGVLEHWRRLVADALATRVPLTKREWAGRFRDSEQRRRARGESRPHRERGHAGAAPVRAAS